MMFPERENNHNLVLFYAFLKSTCFEMLHYSLQSVEFDTFTCFIGFCNDLYLKLAEREIEEGIIRTNT